MLQAYCTVSVHIFWLIGIGGGYYDDFNITLEPLRLTSAGANLLVVDLTSIRCLMKPLKPFFEFSTQ